MGRLLYSKNVFLPLKKKGFPLCYDSIGDQSHSVGFPQSAGPVAGEVSEVYKILVWKVLIHFVKGSSGLGDEEESFEQWQKVSVT